MYICSVFSHREYVPYKDEEKHSRKYMSLRILYALSRYIFKQYDIRGSAVVLQFVCRHKAESQFCKQEMNDHLSDNLDTIWAKLC